jgi:LuxR family transcriptional regulator, maltose regulon positive regulatory protein
MEVSENTARVRIQALGGLEISAGWILRSRRRIRSLATRELLMGLIAAGLRGVGASMLCEALWPEATEGEAFHALIATTRRLRLSLRCRAAVSFEAGRVALDSTRCWVDAWVFEQSVAGALVADEEHAATDLHGALQMYRGPLFGEAHSLLALDARDRLRRSYTHAALAAGARLLRRGDTGGAIQLYERCLAVEDASEELYRALMVTQARAGAALAAARTYERCRQSLEHRFGMSPSRATERARNESCSPQTGSGEGRDAPVAYSATP